VSIVINIAWFFCWIEDDEGNITTFLMIQHKFHCSLNKWTIILLLVSIFTKVYFTESPQASLPMALALPYLF